MYTKAIGKKIRRMATAYTTMLMVPSTKASGGTTSKREQAEKSGLITAASRACIGMERSMGTADLYGLMVLLMKATGWIIRCMGMDFSLGLMGDHTKELMRMIKSTALGYLHGRTGEGLKANGVEGSKSRILQTTP